MRSGVVSGERLEGVEEGASGRWIANVEAEAMLRHSSVHSLTRRVNCSSGGMIPSSLWRCVTDPRARSFPPWSDASAALEGLEPHTQDVPIRLMTANLFTAIPTGRGKTSHCAFRCTLGNSRSSPSDATADGRQNQPRGEADMDMAGDKQSHVVMERAGQISTDCTIWWGRGR